MTKALQSQLVALRGERDLGDQPLARLEDEVVDLRLALDQLEAEWLRRVEALDRRRVEGEEPLLGTTSWLARHCRLSRAGAARHLGRARRLRATPGGVAALDRGEISLAQLDVLGRGAARHPDAFAASEPTLVDSARTLSVRDLGRVVRYWAQNLDEVAAVADAEHLHRRRRLSLSATFMGMYRLDGDLDPEGGGVVATAIDAVVGADRRAGGADDGRTAVQRRADALVSICRSYLDRGDAGSSHGERPHLLVTVDLASLESRAGRRCELDRSGVITPDAARRLACDAKVCRLLVGAESEILDVGRLTRTVTPAQWRALVVRDRCCRFPGCERPPRWCDAHHVRHWIDGGAGDLDNLVLLCRRHHRLLHEGRYRIDASGGHFEFLTPAGRPVEAPPHLAAVG